jgi:hypothetical protein
MRRVLTALLLLAVALSWVIPAQSYTLVYLDSAGSLQLKWQSLPIKVALSASLSSPPSNIKPGSDVAGAARRALQHWQQAANIQFQITENDPRTQVSPNGASDGLSLITVAPQQEASLFAGERTGRTRVFFDPVTGAISEADIAVNPALHYSTDGLPYDSFVTFDLEAVLTHEVGHLLGLEHSAIVGATMQPRQGPVGLYSTPAALAPRTLTEDDIAGVRAIYGPLAGLGAIEGRLASGANGGPLFGGHVWAENILTGRLTASNITLANGHYRIAGLPAGQYRLIAEYLNEPILASEIASSSGAYTGIGSQPAFRTAELATLTVSANQATTYNAILAGGPPPFLNPRLIGAHLQLSTVPVPLARGNTYTIHLGGEGLDQVGAGGLSINSPFFTIDQSSFVQQFDPSGIAVVSFSVRVSASTPVGDYSIRVQSNTGELAYVTGGLTVDYPPDSNLNQIDDPQFFVRQQYLDFLGREPDAGGLAHRTSRMTPCGIDPACLHRRRIDVSAAFFTESEFQETGYYVYRIYKAAFGRRPLFGEFIADRSKVVAGQNLEQSKQALDDEFVQRQAFLAEYPTAMTPEQYVDKLNLNTGNVLTQAGRDVLALGLRAGTETRAGVLRKMAENALFRQRELNAAFVLMQYFGYLRRDPEEGGYLFWLNILNSQPGNARGMVCAFLTSAEYQLRFSPQVVTRSDRDCTQYGP